MEDYFGKKLEDGSINKVTIADKQLYILSLSIGNPTIRARVFKATSSDFPQALKKLQQKAVNLVRKNHLDPQWMKFDIISEIDKVTFEQLEQQIAKTRKNYFRQGIAFDPEFRIAFLEQELNGNAMIRSIKKGPLHLDEKNINHYLQYNESTHRFPFMRNRYAHKDVYLFRTNSFFIDKENSEIKELYDGERSNGIRKIDAIEDETKQLIEKGTYFLTEQVQENGEFIYGYFSAFAKKIGTYNILRHASSLYAMAEGYEIVQDDRIIKKIEAGIDYLIREAIVYKEEGNEKLAFVVDKANENEIKLGSNATAILAITKYTEVTGKDTYLPIAQTLAKGILHMKTPSGGFMHVLTYPTFEIKDLYRIIYYEGEAIFSLLRLYAMDQNELWLEESKKSFDYFIANDYWKYHDHWLSYAANELTMYEPEDKYFIFGMKNCQDRLEFIYHRETTFPTFLELTMAAYKMIAKMKELKKDHLLEHIDEGFLEATIDQRAEYQRVGFFYPELAMYYKEPGIILNGFFIRHHSFRVRIDDVEHYLSGYCQYYTHRVSKLPKNYHVELTNI